MTVTEVFGLGKAGGHYPLVACFDYQVDFLSKIKIELVVPDEDVVE